MGLQDKKCDSCNKEADVLFPIGILDETPTGMLMVKKWYCIECKGCIEDEAEEAEEDDDDGEEESVKIREYTCGCKFRLADREMMIWKGMVICKDHNQVELDADNIYKCGCVVKMIIINFFVYLEVCGNHE